ncbi:MAG: polymer-forming cytoskeletal protein [Verrucomicrobiota bacterium]
MPGSAETTSCTRCQTALDLLDHTIDAECRESLRTVGVIRVTRSGIVSSARLMATDIELAGKVVDSKLQVLRQLRIGPGADFVRGQVQAVDLRVEAGADVRLRNDAFYRNVEVLGRLDATLYATGTVAVRPGGCLAGTVYASRLVVDEGAGLMARPVVGPESWAETEKKMRERFSGSASGPGDAEHVVVRSAPSAPSNP